MDCSTPGFPVPHHLPEFAQVDLRYLPKRFIPLKYNNNYDKKQNALIGLYIMQGWQYVKENDEDKIKEICELLSLFLN